MRKGFFIARWGKPFPVKSACGLEPFCFCFYFSPAETSISGLTAGEGTHPPCGSVRNCAGDFRERHREGH